jgi:hypothetical protein
VPIEHPMMNISGISMSDEEQRKLLPSFFVVVSRSNNSGLTKTPSWRHSLWMILNREKAKSRSPSQVLYNHGVKDADAEASLMDKQRSNKEVHKTH